MTDVSSGCFIVPKALSLLRHGPGAPIWRHLVTLENCILVNAIALAIILLCVGFIAKRMCFWYEPFEILQEEVDKKAVSMPQSFSVTLKPSFLSASTAGRESGTFTGIV